MCINSGHGYHYYISIHPTCKLNEVVEDCDNKSRFECILGQFRHVCFHLGNVNAMTINDTGNWPYVSAREKDTIHDLFE